MTSISLHTHIDIAITNMHTFKWDDSVSITTEWLDTPFTSLGQKGKALYRREKVSNVSRGKLAYVWSST